MVRTGHGGQRDTPVGQEQFEEDDSYEEDNYDDYFNELPEDVVDDQIEDGDLN